ncbi:MAG: DUF29 family protein [Pseudanabaenaceae cyanobacterium]
MIAEVETLGIARRREVISPLIMLLEHFLKQSRRKQGTELKSPVC